MFYKLYSAWVQNSSVITKLYVYRNPVGKQICTCFHFPLSVQSKNGYICGCGLCLWFARAILQNKNRVKLLISVAKCLEPVFYPSRSVVKSSLESLTLCARTGFYSFYQQSCELIHHLLCQLRIVLTYIVVLPTRRPLGAAMSFCSHSN